MTHGCGSFGGYLSCGLVPFMFSTNHDTWHDPMWYGEHGLLLKLTSIKPRSQRRRTPSNNEANYYILKLFFTFTLRFALEN